MTTNELRKRIETTCKKDIDILDVRFYKNKMSAKEKYMQRVIVVYVHRMGILSENIDVWDGDSVEKCILRFIDPDQLTAISGSDITTTSLHQVESL